MDRPALGTVAGPYRGSRFLVEFRIKQITQLEQRGLGSLNYRSLGIPNECRKGTELLVARNIFKAVSD